MNWKQIELFLSTGEAFLPINVDNKGDSVQLLFKDGTIEILDMQIQTFLSKLLYYFGTSISANRRRYGKLVGKKHLVPIVLSYGVILVPYNVRETIGKQSKIGWFISKEIQEFDKQSQDKTFIQLSNHEIVVMHTEKFCREQLKNARCIELCYGEIHEPHRKNWLFSTG
jgi:hypothetical protein